MAVKQPHNDLPVPSVEALAEELVAALSRVTERQLAAPRVTANLLTQKALDAVGSFQDLDSRLAIPPAP